MTWHEALRILSLRNVACKDKDSDYIDRQVCRWYSHYFHTPLHQVYDLPMYDVLQAYYEQHMEDMEEEELREECLSVSRTDEDIMKERAKKDAANYEDYLFEKEAEEESYNPKKVTTVEHGTLSSTSKVQEKKAPIKKQVDDINKPGSETSIPQMAPEGETISMQFIDIEDLEELAEGDGLLGDDDLLGIE